MALRFVLVPQWQGSPSPRAMRLAEGAAALREDLPAAATTEVAVPLEAGDARGTGIARFGSVQLVRERLRDHLAEGEDPAVVIGGDCGVSAGAIEAAAARHPSMALVWFDAHPDLNSPDTSPSGAFAGMVLRDLLDAEVVPPSRVVVAGARSWDPGEEDYAAERGIRSIDVPALADPSALVAAVADAGADSVYLHIDLDVLDPAALSSLLDPEPFGLEPAGLVAAIRALRDRFPLAGATIAAYAPADPAGEAAVEDSATILRLIAALR